jgi:hypothetical protein
VDPAFVTRSIAFASAAFLRSKLFDVRLQPLSPPIFPIALFSTSPLHDTFFISGENLGIAITYGDRLRASYSEVTNPLYTSTRM